MDNALAMMMPPTGLPGVDPTRQPPMPGMSTSTAVAPAPMQRPQPNALANPMAANFNPPKPKQQNMLLSSAVNGFQRGFDPKGWQAGQDQAKADKAEGVKKQIAMLQNIRALPMEQRMQALPQISQSIGKQIPPELMQDQAIDTHLAMLMGEAGMAPNVPEPMSAYEAAQIRLKEEEATRGPKAAIYNTPNGLVEAAPGVDPKLVYETKPEEKPPWQGAVKGEDGQWGWDPRYIEGYRKLHPQQPSGSGKSIKNLTPAEIEARGYPKGTVVQVDENGKEYVNSRPSTQQTGQPTESERSAGLHATVSINGLRNLMASEAAGYNRAGVQEQAAGFVGGENERLYDQAADEFIDGYLRAMTGAAATKTEIETYRKQWFPTWGDTAPVIKQKSAGRLNALKGMKSKAGRAWKPEWDQMITDLEQQTASPAGPQSAGDGPKFPDGTPITAETLAKLSPGLRQIYSRMLPAGPQSAGDGPKFPDGQQAPDGEDDDMDGLIDGLFGDQGQEDDDVSDLLDKYK